MLQLDVPEARELEHAPRHLKSADLCGREAKSQVEARNLDVGFEIHVDGKVDEVGQFSEQSREGLVDLCEAMGLVVRYVPSVRLSKMVMTSLLNATSWDTVHRQVWTLSRGNQMSSSCMRGVIDGRDRRSE